MRTYEMVVLTIMLLSLTMQAIGLYFWIWWFRQFKK